MSILKGTSIVASLTLLSRLLGFVRDLIVARVFGTGLFADAYIVAFRIPNLLRSIFAEGALSSAFVPTFVSELNKDKESAKRAIAEISGFLFLVTLIISILGITFSDYIVSFFAPGFKADATKLSLCISLTKIMMPYIIFVSLVALINGALNSVKSFGASAMAQVVMNCVLIIGGLVAAIPTDKSMAVKILSLSVLVGGIIQVIIQFPYLKKYGFLAWPKFRFSSPVKRTIILMMPAILGACIYQLTIFFSTLFASLIGNSAVSWLFYADRLVQLPVGVFTIALASVLLPELSSANERGDSVLFNKTLIKSLSITSFITIWVSLILFCLAEPLTRMLFMRGSFTEESVWGVASAIRALSFGIMPVSCLTIVNRGFVAKKDTVTPTLLGILSLVFLGFFALTFVGEIQGYAVVSWLQSFLFYKLDLKHVGLSLSTSLAALFTFGLAFIVLFSKNRTNAVTDFGEHGSSYFFKSVFSSLTSATLLGAAFNYLTNPNFFVDFSLFKVVLSSLALSAGYFLINFFFKNKDSEATLRLFARLRKYE